MTTNMETNTTDDKPKLSVSIHKLTSCSGCQLAFLNQGKALLALLNVIDFKHFIEAGLYDLDAKVDLAFVEGSVSTPEDLKRLQKIRQNSKLLITIGACATGGGVQALRNLADGETWKQMVYPHPEFIQTLDTSTPIAEHIHVDYELWGCPVTVETIQQFIQQLLLGHFPKQEKEKVCLECKRKQNVCVVVTKQAPCLGPVTRTGCGALCPEFGKACYGCFGPSELPNAGGLANRFSGLGLVSEEIAQRFAGIHSHYPKFKEQVNHWRAIAIKEID